MTPARLESNPPWPDDDVVDALPPITRDPARPVGAVVRVAEQTLVLLPEKAAFLTATRTLLVADAHFGKATTFRQLGVPVPSGTTAETLAGLSALVSTLGARRIVFLGDFLHSARAQTPGTLHALKTWREQHPELELTLVRGNHDDRAGDPPASLGIEVVDEPLGERGLAFCHHPRPVDGAFVLAGHLHPCIGIGGRAHDWHRLPCFWFTANVGVLPAFGAFTGMHPVRPLRGERVFAVTPGRVVELLPVRPP